jgi:hypothetical protein
VRILAGSGEQAGRMYDYLTGFLAEGFGGMVEGKVLKDRCRFVNGSNVEVLTQSARSVRGQHVQKLRCDEVELFDERVFTAAKFATQSKEGIVGAMEIISTMHRPYGLMQKVVTLAAESGRPLFKWCVWEVMERCKGRTCSQCPLWSDCGGKAKRAAGYLGIDDCIAQMRRSSRAAWEAEMLCIRPNRENVVFAEFDPDVHVAEVSYDANLRLYRSLDFGFVNPFVCLWIQTDGEGNVRIIDEYVRNKATIDIHAAEIKERTPGGEAAVAATFCDPAGKARENVNGKIAIEELRRHGIRTRFRNSRILEGIELVRRAVRNGAGQSRLVISPKCARLIEAMRCYHYPDSNTTDSGSELPQKDGVYDHPIDTLRYFFVNYGKSGLPTIRSY